MDDIDTDEDGIEVFHLNQEQSKKFREKYPECFPKQDVTTENSVVE